MHRGEVDRYPEALADARRAHEMNPNDTFILRILGALEAAAGEHERGLEHLHQAMRLNPRDPHSHISYIMLSYASFVAKQYDEGVRLGVACAQRKAQMIQGHINLTVCLVGVGQIDKAKATFEALQKVASPEYVRSRLEGGVSTLARPEDRIRHLTFLRIAAGLEDPSAADTVR